MGRWSLERKFSAKIANKYLSNCNCRVTTFAICLSRVNCSHLPSSSASQAKRKSIWFRCLIAESGDIATSCKSLSCWPLPFSKGTQITWKWITQCNNWRLPSSDHSLDFTINHPNSYWSRAISKQHHELLTFSSWQRKEILNLRLPQDRLIITIKEDHRKVVKNQIIRMQHGFLSQDHQLSQRNLFRILAWVLTLQWTVQNRQGNAWTHNEIHLCCRWGRRVKGRKSHQAEQSTLH